MRRTKRRNPKHYNTACKLFPIPGKGNWINVVTEDGWVFYVKARVTGRSLGWLNPDPVTLDVIDPDTMRMWDHDVCLASFNARGRRAIALTLLSNAEPTALLAKAAESFPELAALLEEQRAA